MHLVYSGAIKVTVDFHECRALAAVAVLEPLTGSSHVKHSWHVISDAQNFFGFFSLVHFFQDCFHKNRLEEPAFWLDM